MGDEKDTISAQELNSNMKSDDTSKKSDEKNEIGNFELPIDASDDPELALALRMSMETNTMESKATESKIEESDTTEGAAKEEKMEVDDAPTKQASKSTTGDDGEEDYS